ncbi:hypothetical protein P7K49_025799 [Saguinus oedipus]|uniref:Uncharacterized protein n=1 Tax=Saguinus oedipus TaxID=9490 RepID=A0ABQ9UJ01_SAGOE|nr:hypothetical protein P7K49_025799 [Saguinus oedipus]
MARKLSVLEVLLIIFCLIVVAVDILLLLLVLEEPSDEILDFRWLMGSMNQSYFSCCYEEQLMLSEDTSFTPECPEIDQSDRIDCTPGQAVTENRERETFK